MHRSWLGFDRDIRFMFMISYLVLLMKNFTKISLNLWMKNLR